MKTKSILTTALGIASALFLLTSCGEKQTNNNIVEFSCDQAMAWINLSNFESSAPSSNGTLLAYLPGPTLFYIFCDDKKGNDEFIYLYLPEDGNRIHLRATGDLLYANNTIHSITVNPKQSSPFTAWYASADKNDFNSIRLISAQDEPGPEVQEIIKLNPDISICTGDLEDEIISRGKPLIFSACFSTNDMVNREKIIKQDLRETRMLMLDESMPETLAALSEKSLPRLSRIMPMGDALKTNKLFDAFPDIKAITIGVGKEPPDLGNLNCLEELHIGSDEGTAVDLSQLPNPEALRMLTILEHVEVTGLEKLTHLEYLNPGELELSDKELAALLSNHPKLVFLNLIYATIESLEPLKGAPDLEVVMLGEFSKDDLPDFSPLKNLKNLRHVGLTEDCSEEHPEIAQEIQNACPQVEVYMHDKFCLGSGWLILFIPALLILVLQKHFHSKAGPSGEIS